MLGQSCNGEFAIGEIEDILGASPIGLAFFTAARQAMVFADIGPRGEAVFAPSPPAVLTASLGAGAIVNVEIT